MIDITESTISRVYELAGIARNKAGLVARAYPNLEGKIIFMFVTDAGQEFVIGESDYIANLWKTARKMYPKAKMAAGKIARYDLLN